MGIQDRISQTEYTATRVGNFHLEVQVPWYYCLEPRVTSTQGLEVCFQLFSSQGLESLEPFNSFQVKALKA